MFTAVIFACHIIMTDKCMIITDTRGPYFKQEQCADRLDQMAVDLHEYWRKEIFITPFEIKSKDCVREGHQLV